MSISIYAAQDLNMRMAIRSILDAAGTNGSTKEVEFLARELQCIPFPQVPWVCLSTTERTLLRFAWEYAHRTACPLPLHPEA